MKKLTSLILTLSMILTLSACSDNENSSTTDNNISSVTSSESEAELTFDEKFRGLDQELRYDEVIELLGEPDEKGGVSVKYLSYKQDDGKSAIVQFLYGDNPRIDYTYVTDLETKEEEIILHRRICDHENGYCSFDIRYSKDMQDFIEKAKAVKKDMTIEEVTEILGEPYSIFGGGASGSIDYHPDMYHKIHIYTGSSVFLVQKVYVWDRLVFGETEAILPQEGEKQGKFWTVRTISEQDIYMQKVSETQLTVSLKSGVPLKDYLNDYIGEYDEEIDEGDITKLVYKLNDGKLAHVCISNKEPEPIIEFTYVYDPETKKVTKMYPVVEDCDYEKYLPDDTKD